MYCIQCGKEIDEQSKYCMYCGNMICSKEEAEKYYNQGYNYYTGTNGCLQDYQKALECFKVAASMDYLEAINYLGLMYMNGTGVPMNVAMAIEWFNKALKIDSKFGRASYNLGRIYYIGIGVVKNYDMAYNYFLKAIDNGRNEKYYAYACHFIGYILMQVKKKPLDSVKFFFDAVKNDESIAEAWHNLGLLCEKGYFKVEGKSYLYYYNKGAELGFSGSIEAIGRFYLKQSLVLSGYKKIEAENLAKKWFEAAAKAGSDSAKKRLRAVNWATKLSYNNVIENNKESNLKSEDRHIEPTITTNSKRVVFTDGKGRTSVQGGAFYDGRGNLCKWGTPFYDWRGNLCKWGTPFYDSKGNLCKWGSPFYDGNGDLICP